MQIKQLYKLSFFIFLLALCNVIHYNISVKRKRDRTQ
nr:MAG TPA: antigen S-antigen protein [Caudoviricetes sp.]